MSETATAPPQNLDAEESVLGAMMVSDAACQLVLAEAHLRPEHFYRERHREIYRAIAATADRGSAVDAITVSDELTHRGKLDAAGGKAIVSSLASTTPAAGNALHYARIILEEADWRRKLGAAGLIKTAAADRDRGKLAEAEAILIEDTIHPESFYDEDRQRELLFELLEGQAEAEFHYPLSKLNRLHRLGRGQLLVLSGYTNEGKSHFADQILDINRKHSFRVCLYDNEMRPASRAARRAARMRGLPSEKVVRGDLDDREKKALLEHINQDQMWPITDIAGWSPQEVSHDIRRRRWDLVVVDILHNFQFADERELSAAVATFKQAAMQADCALVLVAHVNRQGVEKGKRRRPVRSDLRWSGDIENLADAVLFVYREQDEETLEQLDTGYVYFDKVREGKLGAQAVRFNQHRLSFLPTEVER